MADEKNARIYKEETRLFRFRRSENKFPFRLTRAAFEKRLTTKSAEHDSNTHKNYECVIYSTSSYFAEDDTLRRSQFHIKDGINLEADLHGIVSESNEHEAFAPSIFPPMEGDLFVFFRRKEMKKTRTHCLEGGMPKTR